MQFAARELGNFFRFAELLVSDKPAQFLTRQNSHVAAFVTSANSKVRITGWE